MCLPLGLRVPEAAASLPLGLLKCSSQLWWNCPNCSCRLRSLEPSLWPPLRGRCDTQEYPRGVSGVLVPPMALIFFLHLSSAQARVARGRAGLLMPKTMGHWAQVSVGPSWGRGKGVTQLLSFILHLPLGPGPQDGHGPWCLGGSSCRVQWARPRPEEES